MNAVQVKMLWPKYFTDSQESLESDPYPGRPATSRTPEKVECVWAAINEDWQLTVWEQEADLGIPKPTVSEILMQDLGMQHVAKFVLWLLLPEQKEQRAAVGRTVWDPKVPTWKRTEASLSCVQCFLYLASSSIYVSIFSVCGCVLSGQTSYTPGPCTCPGVGTW